MPGRKRKASSNSATPSKKVRIGNTTDIPDQPSSLPRGRPKRASNATTATTESEPAVKRRGRPPKSVTSTPTTSKAEEAPKKGRGRPPKKGTTSLPKPNTTSPKTARAFTSKKAPAKAPARSPKQRSRQPKPAPEELPHSESDSDSLERDEVTADVDDSKPEEALRIDNDVQYWLMKAEPESRIENGYDVKFSIDDLAAKTEPEAWDGVRNAVARNNMRAMRKGDLAFFYHSNCKVPGVAGVMRIVMEHSPDESAFDPKHPYFDPKSDRSKPKWDVVHVEFVKKFDSFISLRELRAWANSGGALQNMQMLKQSRLSVSSVSPEEWRFILKLAEEPLTLGHGDGMSGYESEVDGEGEETMGVSDADLTNGMGDGGVGLGISGAPETEVPAVVTNGA